MTQPWAVKAAAAEVDMQHFSRQMHPLHYMHPLHCMLHALVSCDGCLDATNETLGCNQRISQASP